MRRYRIGSIVGIPIQLDLTFLLVLPLFAYLIGAQVEPVIEMLNTMGASLDVAALTEGFVPWLLGITAAVGLFVGVVLHELGHSLMARRFGFPIESITLWLFGGIAQFDEMPEDWKQELWISLAGPAVSFALGALSYVAFTTLPADGGVVVAGATFVLGYLAILNVVLGVFNLLPGFPMDGGRVLRALLARTRPYARATELAAEVGKAFAILLGLFGLFVTFNILLIGLAFFIYIAAESESRQTVMRVALEGVTVRDVMTPADRVSTVSTDTSVQELIGVMFEERHTGYPVERNGDIVGIVTLDDARAVREVERDAYTVEDVMTSELYGVSPDDDVMDALEDLDSEGVGRLFVFDDQDEFVGLLTRTDIMTALSIIRSSDDFTPPGEEHEPTVLRPGA